MEARLLVDSGVVDLWSEKVRVERLLAGSDDFFLSGLRLAAGENDEGVEEDMLHHQGAGNERQRSLPPACFPPRRWW